MDWRIHPRSGFKVCPSRTPAHTVLGFRLEDLRFTIAPNSSLAIVGTNGAGKTTLVKLLLGLYIPDRGAVTLGSHPIREVRRSLGPAAVGAVFQRFQEVRLTLRENVTLGHCDDEGDERVLSALADVGLSALVSSAPTGLDTVLTTTHLEGALTRGFDLSHGQWQRFPALIATTATTVVLGAAVPFVSSHVLPGEFLGMVGNHAIYSTGFKLVLACMVITCLASLVATWRVSSE